MVHIILTASSGVADKLKTREIPIPSKLTDKIGEQATPSSPGKMQNVTLDCLIRLTQIGQKTIWQ